MNAVGGNLTHRTESSPVVGSFSAFLRCKHGFLSYEELDFVTFDSWIHERSACFVNHIAPFECEMPMVPEAKCHVHNNDQVTWLTKQLRVSFVFGCV